MEIKVIRDTFTQNSTIGRLFVDGKFAAYTLEDVRRADGVKVHGKTCIPPGKYRVIVNLSNRFKRLMPRLLDVPNFDGVLIHYGNTAADTEGCLLVGQTKAVDFIGQSRAAFAPLFEQINAAIADKQEVWIEIAEEK